MIFACKKMNIFFLFLDSSVLFTDYSLKTALQLSVDAFFMSYSLISKDFNCQLSIVNMLVLCWCYVGVMLTLCWCYVDLMSGSIQSLISTIRDIVEMK